MKIKINNKRKYDYIIYHRNCPDGYGSLFLIYLSKITSKPLIFADTPSTKKVPPNVKGKRIIIVDVAYNPKIFKQIVEEAEEVLYIDHHTANMKDIYKVIEDDKKELGDKVKIIFDKDHSAVYITWKYLFGSEKVPKLIKHLDDHDMGFWKMKDTRPLITAIEVEYPLIPKKKYFKKWISLFDEANLQKVIDRGKMYYRYKQYLIMRNSKNYHLLRYKNYNMAMINMIPLLSSELATHLAQMRGIDFVASWHYNHQLKLYITSLRSKEMDVEKIAREFGGGGHKNASAFNSKVNPINLFEPSLTTRV